MIRYIFMLALGLTGCRVNAQRMVSGQKGLEINISLLNNKEPEKNFMLALGLSISSKNGNYLLLGTEYCRQSDDYMGRHIPFEIYDAQLGYNLRLLGNARKSINVYAGLSGIAGYQMVNGSKKELFDGAMIQNKDGFVYGATGRICLEAYLSDRFVFLIIGNAKMLWGVLNGSFQPSAGFGLRFNF